MSTPREEQATYFVYRTPLGRITLASDGVALTHLAFGLATFAGQKRPNALTNKASSEVLEYLAGKRQAFSVPLHPGGSAFQAKVWDQVARIPYGTTCTYAQLAADLGNPKGVNAVSSACVKNPLPILIPTHRVIGVHGDVGSFVTNPAVKRFLIDLEASANEGRSRVR